jgi:hypothetical protein
MLLAYDWCLRTEILYSKTELLNMAKAVGAVTQFQAGGSLPIMCMPMVEMGGLLPTELSQKISSRSRPFNPFIVESPAAVGAGVLLGPMALSP